MFDYKHYVPTLKWKASEYYALKYLKEKEKNLITPLIQLIMSKPKASKKDEQLPTWEEQLKKSIEILKIQIPQIPVEIFESWGSSPAFVDVGLIDASLRKEAITEIIKTGNIIGATLIPVVNLSSDKSIQSAMVSVSKEKQSGICLRLFRSDFNSDINVGDKVKQFLIDQDVEESEIDLLIDFQILDDGCSRLHNLCEQIPNLLKWRTFTFACGSFPVDLTSFVLGVNYVARHDWKNWFTQIKSSKLKRNPSFSDYTIQHPIYNESFQSFSPSASIRYTLNDKWLVMRGQKNKHIQYLANARLLSQHSDFFGAKFSFGDKYIADKGTNLKGKTGNPMTWLIAGINHHLACTVKQIANLS
ncbi:MAG: hypothetical protein COV46_05085 [Deltaproteobacteria bacterium CG11_big_fil_rev_8_21_14_0_20_49_13]|nr:MAG: hypothetical protein COV46_05085 [Deltaproteobacteria bacterium CG11_big_fil_rev_8_21_14_0_20_49_13]